MDRYGRSGRRRDARPRRPQALATEVGIKAERQNEKIRETTSNLDEQMRK